MMPAASVPARNDFSKICAIRMDRVSAEKNIPRKKSLSLNMHECWMKLRLIVA